MHQPVLGPPIDGPANDPPPRRFLLLMLLVNPGLNVDDVQRQLGYAPPGFAPSTSPLVQFYRIANNVWLLHTNLTIAAVSARVEGLARPAGTYFLTRVDVAGHNGFLPQAVWDWIRGRAAEGT